MNRDQLKAIARRAIKVYRAAKVSGEPDAALLKHLDNIKKLLEKAQKGNSAALDQAYQNSIRFNPGNELIDDDYDMLTSLSHRILKVSGKSGQQLSLGINRTLQFVKDAITEIKTRE